MTGPESMHGGTMSMMWMRMPGQTWPGTAASFLGMWVVMMIPMMLPSLVPVLWRYRAAIRRSGGTHLDGATALLGSGYFFVWTVVGAAIYPLGVALAALEMRLPALVPTAPIAVGVIVLLGAALQLTAWKARHLACCREMGHVPAATAGAAWRHGMHLGLHCAFCSSGLMLILLAVGLMDLPAMVVIAVAMNLERLAPDGERTAKAIGAAAIAAGLIFIASA